jgi:hypothetical protein
MKMNLMAATPVWALILTNDEYEKERLDNWEEGFNPEHEGCQIEFWPTESSVLARAREIAQENGADEGWRVLVMRVTPSQMITYGTIVHQETVGPPVTTSVAPARRRGKKAVTAPSPAQTRRRRLDLSEDPLELTERVK